MLLLLHNIEAAIFDSDLRVPVAARLGLAPDAVASVRILRRSIDARQHRRIRFVYQLAVSVPADFTPPATAGIEPWVEPELPRMRPACLADGAPTVVGAGPAGLFAALALCEAGLRPRIIERGRPALERAADVNRFWAAGTLDPESNMYFGEGGAGTFSDGKLNTRSKNPLAAKVLDELVRLGAPAEVRYEAQPHLGTDRLLKLLAAFRERLTAVGATFQFSTCLGGLRLPGPGRPAPEVCLNGAWSRAWPLVLACGHSALDTYRLLASQGVELGTKGNAIGCRIEHPSDFVTRHWYGGDVRVRRLLGHAPYNLAVPVGNGQGGVYTFCCCPGGEVVSCAAVPGQVGANGMSFSRRDSPFTNAGLVARLQADEIAGSAMAAIEWRERLERACFAAGGGGFGLPAQRASDFLKGRASTALPAASSRRPLVPGDLGRILPDTVVVRLRDGLRAMDRKVPGWVGNGVLIGVETTTSAPVQVLRTPQGESVSCPGLLPVGEGSGYAGGIVTSAIDGYQAVSRWLDAHCPAG